jgi:hypothetical protein
VWYNYSRLKKERTMSLPLAEELAKQVSSEYGRLKQLGVKYVNYSQILMNVITGNGQYTSDEISSLRKEIAKIQAQKRKEKREKKERAEYQSHLH